MGSTANFYRGGNGVYQGVSTGSCDSEFRTVNVLHGAFGGGRMYSIGSDSGTSASGVSASGAIGCGVSTNCRRWQTRHSEGYFTESHYWYHTIN